MTKEDELYPKQHKYCMHYYNQQSQKPKCLIGGILAGEHCKFYNQRHKIIIKPKEDDKNGKKNKNRIPSHQ